MVSGVFAHLSFIKNNITLKLCFLTMHLLLFLSVSAVCGSAQLPAAAGNTVVRRLPGLEETTLGRQTGHLLHHRTPVSCFLTGKEGGNKWECEEGKGEGMKKEKVWKMTLGRRTGERRCVRKGGRMKERKGGSERRAEGGMNEKNRKQLRSGK